MTEQWDARRSSSVPRDVARLLSGVPGRLGREDANAAYIGIAREMETWVARDIVGTAAEVTLMMRCFLNVAEVHLTAVERGHHGRGAGGAMIEVLERDAWGGGVRSLMAKTLGPPHPDPGHARTRRFYKRMGFLPLEETHLWGEGIPCLIMVRPFIGWTPTTGTD